MATTPPTRRGGGGGEPRAPVDGFAFTDRGSAPRSWWAESIGDDFWIEDEEGKRAFRVDGKALRLRETFHLEDLQGRHLCKHEYEIEAR